MRTEVPSPFSVSKGCTLLLVAAAVFLYGIPSVSAQTSDSELYVPLIGITSVPDPLVLPKGAGNVTYQYAVKNFLPGEPLIGITVVDDKCRPVTFISGDSNGDSRLDYGEIWKYTCRTKVSTTTESTATATGSAHDLTATHTARVTVDVGAQNPPPLISIINVTKIAHPFSLPVGGGEITFVYKVTNPGLAPLAKVTVTSDTCRSMSGQLGDTNYNGLLDMNEVWIYTCTATLTQTITNTATVTAYANGRKSATNSAVITIEVKKTPILPDVGENPNLNTMFDLKNTAWAFLSGVLVMLIVFLFTTMQQRKKSK